MVKHPQFVSAVRGEVSIRIRCERQHHEDQGKRHGKGEVYLRQPGTADASGQRVGEQEHRLRLRQPWEYPVEEGVCLHDGYAGNGDQDGELRLREHGLEGPADKLQRRKERRWDAENLYL